MAKTNPIGVRFRQDILDDLKKEISADSPQKALVFLERFYVQYKDKISILDCLRDTENIVEQHEEMQPVGLRADVSKIKTFDQILSLAKSGINKEIVEAAMTSVSLMPNQIDLIKRKME